MHAIHVDYAASYQNVDGTIMRYNYSSIALPKPILLPFSKIFIA